MIPRPDHPLDGQRSVWTLPRPAIAERTSSRLRAIFAGQTIAETTHGVMTLETSHPPSYYFPPEDIEPSVLFEVGRRTICEWKGVAAYFDVAANGRTAAGAAWGYPEPTAAFAMLKDHVAFYAGMMDACFVDDEQVVPQAGGFYGGWITSAYAGPFKGGRDPTAGERAPPPTLRRPPPTLRRPPPTLRRPPPLSVMAGTYARP